MSWQEDQSRERALRESQLQRKAYLERFLTAASTQDPQGAVVDIRDVPAAAAVDQASQGQDGPQPRHS